MQYDSDLTEDSQHVIKLAPKAEINGVAIDVDHWPVTESPEVNLKDNVLDIGKGTDHIRVDWRAVVPVISR